NARQSVGPAGFVVARSGAHEVRRAIRRAHEGHRPLRRGDRRIHSVLDSQGGIHRAVSAELKLKYPRTQIPKYPTVENTLAPSSAIGYLGPWVFGCFHSLRASLYARPSSSHANRRAARFSRHADRLSGSDARSGRDAARGDAPRRRLGAGGSPTLLARTRA